MSSIKKITKIYKSAKILDIDEDSKIVLMSDCHRGDNSAADNFLKNHNLFYSALSSYYKDGFTYIELGDGDELWENKKFFDIACAHHRSLELMKKFYRNGRLYLIYGNHDMVKNNKKWVKENLNSFYCERDNKQIPLFKNIHTYEGIRLKCVYTGNEIFLIHGHQVDLLNYSFWKLSRFLVRYLWRPLELIGIKDPGSAQKNHFKKMKIEKKLMDWSDKERKILIAGHTHRAVFPKEGDPLYFNDGCCVRPYYITAIEIENAHISLVEWNVQTKEDGTLYVRKDIINGPEKISNFFDKDQ